MTCRTVLVADSSRARIYRVERSGGPLCAELDWVHPESRLHERDLTSDRQGRTFDSAGQGRHAMGSPEPAKRHEAEQFAHRLAAYLERERARGKLDEVVMIAPPEFLGVLRKACTESCRKLITHSVAKDLTRVETDAIEACIAELH